MEKKRIGQRVRRDDSCTQQTSRWQRRGKGRREERGEGEHCERGNGYVDSGAERSEEGESSAQQRCTSHIVGEKAEEEGNILRGEGHDTERGRKSGV